MRDGINDRIDEYGGLVKNCCCFLFEIVKVVGNVVGFEWLGVWVFFFMDILNVIDFNFVGFFVYLVEVLSF